MDMIRIIVSLFVGALCAVCERGDAQTLNSVAYSAPDGTAIVICTKFDPPDLIRSRKMIVIAFVDNAREMVAFSEVSFERYTKVLWNTGSSRCAILNAPDNAVSDLWIVLKSDSGWETKTVEVFRGMDELLGIHGRNVNTRGGIEEMRWSTSTRLQCKGVYENKAFEILIDTTTRDFSVVRTIPTSNKLLPTKLSP